MVKNTVLGFLGLGAMGGPMARNLVRAGYRVVAYDIVGERVAECVAQGAEAGCDEADVVRRSEMVLSSLRSSEVFVQVAEAHLVPNARAGQVFIDLGTVTPPETRRIAELLKAKGAELLDVPVSGGPGGAEKGRLYMFAGGDEAIFRRCLPILEVLGDPAHITYCGPSGSGQVVKGVNQLAMGLGAAAYLEALAFAVRAGVDAETACRAVSGPEGWRREFGRVAQQVVEGKGDQVYVKFPELPYFLREAKEKGFPMPLTQALYEFLRVKEPTGRDNMGRPTVAFWGEVSTRRLRK